MKNDIQVPDRPEIQLLLACVRPTVAHHPEWRTADHDWEFLLREARRHSVLPLLYRGLCVRGAPQPPVPVVELLRAACRKMQQRNLALTAELFRMLDAFARAGIAAVPFKGPVLAKLAYNDLSLRTFGDLDVLVRDRDIARARKVLETLGYTAEFEFTSAEERAFHKAECALQFRHAGLDVVLELHWRLTERYLSIDLPVEDFWARLRPMPLAGRMVPAFAPEDLLLYLCIHGGKHEWERLECLCALAWLVAAQPDVDWAVVRQRARACGTERLLHSGLLLARSLLRIDLPWEMRSALGQDSAAAGVAAELTARMFEPQTPEAARGHWYFFLLRSRERWRDRARIVFFSWVRIPHPDSRELVALPRRLSFLYYLFRPARLLSASMAAAWRYGRNRRAHAAREERAQSICIR